MTNVHESISKTHRPSLKEIDTQRASNSAYNYLCHLEECKQWIEKMINKEYIDIKDFESQLCNGIDLCLLALKFSPESVKKIHYGKRRTASKAKVEITGNNKITGETTSEKDYRYTDNIYFFLSALRTINLPEYFLFDTVSLYEGKNIHSVVYCLHALCHFLNYKGYTNIRINTLYGMEFSSALIEEKNEELKERERMGMKIPEFKNITKVMHKDFLSDLLTRIKYHCHALQRKEKRDKEERARQLLEEQMQISEKNKSKQAENYRLSVTKDRLFFHLLDSLSHKSDDTVSTALKTFLYKNVFHELIDKKRISIFTIKFYLFIFYDSNNEIKKENEIERIINDCNILRNENYEIEKYNDELEMRVNLLLNNKINASNISVVKPRLEDVMDTNYAYDAEGYNFVFNVMQTEPEWLCFLFERVKHINDFIMTGVINLFSNERAEEMYLLSLTECAFRKLVDRITKVQKHKEDKHSCNDSYMHKEVMHGYSDNGYNTSYINERAYFEDDFDSLSFLNEQPLFLGIKALMGVYFKGLHNAFKDSLINNIRNLESFEFENDPAKIYKNIFDVDISREDALKNETVSKIYLTRLKTLRGVIDGIIDLLFKHTNDFSVCIRVFMKSLRSVHVKESDLLSLFFKEFMYPFVIGPDAYSDFKVTPDTRDKLKMVVKGFECAINGESVYSLRPLERFFKESKQRLIEFITKFTSIEETYDYGYIFNVKPCVIFTGKQANLFTSTVYDCINACGGAKACELSVLQRKKEVNDSTVIHDSSLIYDSSAIYNNTEISAKHTSTMFTDDRNADLCTFMHTCDGVKLPFLTKMIDILEYRKSLPDTDKPINFYLNKPVTEDAAESEQDKFVKRLKMKVIELLRIANGRNLLDVIIRDSGSEEEKEYQERIEELRSKAMEQELSHSSSQSIMFLNSSNLYDIYLVNNEIRYPDLNSFKDSIYDEMQILEGMKIVRRENHYNDMLCLLAEDILRVKYMSKERNRCLDIHKRNLAGLKDRKEEVRALMKNMETYLTSYVKTTFKNKGNIKGKDCEFGSFKVSGSKLKKKGVLIEMHRNGQETITDSNECIKDLTFVFMCEEPGIFVVEIFMHTVVVNTFSFRFDELLKLRFRRVDNFVIKEVCTFEVGKLTELLNKHYVN